MRFIIMMAIHFLAMTVLMGVGIIVVLSAGMIDGRSILLAVAGGFVLALPVTWVITRRLLANTPVQG